jgi:hypothetical protein
VTEAVAAVILCDRCGQRRVGIVTRQPRYFEYQPEVVPAFTHHKTIRQWWSPARAHSTERQTVFCQRCGWLDFPVGPTIAAARRIPPGGKPATIRAFPAARP